jgi:hypothetical protein
MDNHEGAGGSYVVDPKTGIRTLVERTKDAADKAVSEPKPKPEPKKPVKFEE